MRVTPISLAPGVVHCDASSHIGAVRRGAVARIFRGPYDGGLYGNGVYGKSDSLAVGGYQPHLIRCGLISNMALHFCGGRGEGWTGGLDLWISFTV